LLNVYIGFDTIFAVYLSLQIKNLENGFLNKYHNNSH